MESREAASRLGLGTQGLQTHCQLPADLKYPSLSGPGFALEKNPGTNDLRIADIFDINRDFMLQLADIHALEHVELSFNYADKVSSVRSLSTSISSS